MVVRASPISPTLLIVRILACAMACMLATAVAWAGPSDVTDPEAPRSLPADGPVDVRWTDPAQFTFDMDRRRHVWNTFDAHRLLHWAGLESLQAQRALKHALLRAYFTDGENVSYHDVLARLAESAGLDGARARQILASDEFADAVRERERHYTGSGITAVPSVILHDRHLVQGGQPVEVFERALRPLRSEERRGGKEGVSTCRTGRGPETKKKK